MNTWQKGEIAFFEVVKRACEKGLIPSKPMIEGARYDLILEEEGRLIRAQVKYANGKDVKCSGVAVVGLRRFNNGTHNVRVYHEGEIDLLLVYVPAIDKVCCFGPDVFDGKTALSIRYEEPKNKQKNKCLMAKDYVW